MASIFSVARYMLNHGGEMTTMKMEKLTYYCQAWSLAWDGVPLFDEDFQAWANGPVCPELFATHKELFWLKSDFYDEYPSNFSNAEIETMDAVLRDYRDKEPQWLSWLTHMERPWRETREGVKPGEACSRVIKKDLMQEYYEGLISDEEAKPV